MATLARYLVFGIALVVASCAAPQRPLAEQRPAAEPQRPGVVKRVTIAILGDAPQLYNSIGAASGSDDVAEELVNRGLVEADDTRVFLPVLAEAIPTIENGLWKLFPDGRMETTWRIKPGAEWHDGAPYTADDLVFTLRASMDPELPLVIRPAFASIESVTAPDPRTVTVRWARPFIDADKLFSREMALPLPRHLLERAAAEDKANFANLSYWTEEFVGTGPFKVKETLLGTPALLQANDRYVLGRPKIDEIELRVFADPNTLAASILSDTVDLVLGRGFDFDQAMVVESQWRGGRVETRFSGTMAIYTQLVGRTPPVIGEVQFRRALLHAVDRQQMIDVLMNGRSTIAHSFLGSNEPEYPDAESSLVRYEYDPRRAAQLIEGLGYTRGPDGIYRDAANQRLSVEIRAEQGQTEEKSSLAVADYWQQAGVGVETTVAPRQRARDLEYQYTFPAFNLRGQSSRIAAGLSNYQGSQSPYPENRWVGNNRGRYVNPELDAAIDRYVVTIPIRERVQELQTIVRLITDQLPIMNLFYSVQFTLIANRVENMVPVKGSGTAGKTWNSQLWDVK